MTCPSCHAEVPPGQLVCNCFQVNADNEVQERALAGFLNDSVLWVTRAATSGRHILPASKTALSLCHKKRFQRADTSPIDKHRFSPEAQRQPEFAQAFCKACAEVVNTAIARGVV
jgi:hypothetical protein